MSNVKLKIKSIFFLGFLLSFQLAFTSYISSSFLSAFSGEKDVGLIYVLGSALALLALLFTPRILRRIGEYKFLLRLSGLGAVLLFLLSVLKQSYLIIPLFIVYFALNYLIVFALDELVQIFSRNASLGSTRGLYLTVINLAWVIAQALSGRTIAGLSFSSLYLVAFAIMSVFFLVAFLGLKNLNDPHYDKGLAWQSFKNFFSNKNLRHAYKINFLLQFFYVWMVVYTPIYLYSHLGFTWPEIAQIFTIMLLPFVLIQFPLGRYADKIGERKMLIFGFMIAGIATTLLFFIKLHAVWIWAVMLFLTRIGAAIIEVMSDVHFFKHINKENDEFIAIYRNTAPVSYLLAPLVAFAAFSFVASFNYIFLVLGALMFYGVYLSSKIRRNDI